MPAQIAIDPEQVADFCRRHEVQELALFGSALREDFGPASDVDLLVTFIPGTRVSLFDLVDMAEDLSRLFGRRVDLVPKSGLKALAYAARYLRARRSSMPRRDDLYLADILEAAESIRLFVSRFDQPGREHFVADDLV